MDEAKRAEIKALIESLWSDPIDLNNLVHTVENGYIFGEYGDNEHYKSSDILAIAREVQAEKEVVEE